MFPLDRRFLLVCAAVCLGTSTGRAQPKDDAAKARMAVRLDSPDGMDCIDDVAFSADRKVIALFQTDLRIRLWDTETGQWRATLGGHRHDYTDLFAVVDSGKTVLFWNGTGAGACLAWDVKTGESRTVFNKVGRDGRDARWSAAASLDGKRVATVHCGGQSPAIVRGWDVGTGKELWEFKNDDGKQMVHVIAFAPDGKQLAVGTQDGKVRLLNAATGKEAAVLDDGKNEVCALEWSADGKRLAAVQRGARNIARIVVWDVAKAKIAGEIGPLTTPGHGALSPDGKHFAAMYTGGTVAVWAVPGEKPVASVKVAGRRAMAWSADGKSILVVREYPKTLELLTFDLVDLLPKK
jgi:WD40 repeat protein